MNNDMEEMMKHYYQWNLLNPRNLLNPHIKPTENKKNEIFSKNSIEILSDRKPSLPNINPMNYNRNNYLINSRPNYGLSRISMFPMDRSYSTNYLFSLKNSNKNFTKIDRSVYVDFQNKNNNINLDKLRSISDEEIHTYEFVQAPQENLQINSAPCKNTYLELTNLNFTEDISETNESENMSKNNLIKESIFEKNDFEIFQLTPNKLKNDFILLENTTETLSKLQPKNSFEIIKKAIKKVSTKSDNEVQEALRHVDKFSRLQSQIKTSDLESLNKLSTNSSNTKSSVDSGISTENMTNKQGSCNLISSTSQDQMNSIESVMDSTDSFQFQEKSPVIDMHKFNFETKLNPQENLSKVLSSEEDHALLRKIISKEITNKSHSIKEIIKFHLEDETYSSQLIDESECAVAICDKLTQHFHKASRSHWQLYECIYKECLERPIEDHESIQDIFKSWKQEFPYNRFILKENLNIYKLFLKSNIFVTEMENNFQISDYIWIKETNSKWKKVFASISDSTVYFNEKPDSKNIADSYPFVNLQKYDFYTCNDQNKIKKIFKAPTIELIILKSKKIEQTSQNYPCICLSTELQKEKWIEALKIAKFTFNQLKKNYLEYEKRAGANSRIRSYSIKSFYPLVTNFCGSSV